MLFPTATIEQMKTLSDDSLNHTCTITDPGDVYDGAAQVYDDEVMIDRMTGGDASFNAEALIRLPHQSHADWSRKTFDQDNAVAKASYEGIVQTGRVAKVMRKQAMCFVGVNWMDSAVVSDLGTISDLQVFSNGAESVVLTFTAATGATSHQAQVGGVDSGSSVSGTTEIIVLSGLTAGSKSFRVVASDGSDTTNSNAVVFVVT